MFGPEKRERKARKKFAPEDLAKREAELRALAARINSGT